MIPIPATFFRSAGPAGGPAFVQAVFSDSIVIASELPVDDTVPLISEGAEILALTITPQGAASRFLIEANIYASPKGFVDISPDFNTLGESFSEAWAAALFRGATCVQAQCVHAANGEPCGQMLRLTTLETPEMNAPITWSVRVGPSRHFTSGTPSSPGPGLRVNGEHIQTTVAGVVDPSISRDTRYFGGAAKCTLIIQELP
jgi:hypothetical protein